MSEFLALYSGRTVNGSEVVAITANPTLVRDFAERMLYENREEEPGSATTAAASVENGRRGALKIIRDASA